jgi:uncharacterized DUF497 family protein
VKFEWDRWKAAANFRKHRVSFEEALTVFADPLGRIHDDPKHSTSEHARSLSVIRLAGGSCWYPLSSGKTQRASSARDGQRRTKEMTTKKASSKIGTDELRSEYRFDYRVSRPNRFASRMGENVIAVVLDPDVASVYKTSASVNRALRSSMKARSARSCSKRKAG